jgi:hypothetical protein
VAREDLGDGSGLDGGRLFVAGLAKRAQQRGRKAQRFKGHVELTPVCPGVPWNRAASDGFGGRACQGGHGLAGVERAVRGWGRGGALSKGPRPSSARESIAAARPANANTFCAATCGARRQAREAVISQLL